MASQMAKSDLLTGAFAVLVVACITFVVLFLQAWSPETEGDRYTVRFEDAGGLSLNAPVVVAGQKVGKVEKIAARPVVTEEGGHRVEIEVQFIIEPEFARSVAVPTDTLAEVQPGGLFGGTQLVLKLGDHSEVVRPGQRLPVMGRPSPNLNDIMASAKDTFDELQKGVDKLADVLNDDEFIEALRNSLKNLDKTLEKFAEGLEEIGPALSEVGPTIENANALLTEIRDLIEENNESITSALTHIDSAAQSADKLLAEDGEVTLLVGDLRRIAANLDTLVENLDTLVLDNQVNISTSLENIRQSTESIRVFARRIEADPSLLIWGTDEQPPGAGAEPATATPGVDERALRRSGRTAPRREND